MGCIIAGVVLYAKIVALLINELGLPVPCVHVRIVDRNYVFELVVVDLANALGGDQFVAVRQSGRVQERVFVEAVAFNKRASPSQWPTE